MNQSNPNKDDRDTAMQSLALHVAGGLVLAAIVGCCYAFIIGPLRAEDRNLRHLAATYQTQLGQQPELLRQYERAKERFEIRKDRLQELMARIPDNPEESEFLAQLTRLAIVSELAIGEYHPGTISKAQGCSSIQVKIVGQASYAGICRFLHGLAGIPRFCEVTDVQIGAVQTSDELHPVDIAFTIYFAPAQTVPSA
jgi:Tfp pilus assembly protein PilO